jgi:hypothetical protein
MRFASHVPDGSLVTLGKSSKFVCGKKHAAVN